MKLLIAIIMLAALVYFGRAFFTPAEYALNDADIAHADRVVSQFMSRYDVPGLSLAWAKDGRIILTRAYGVVNKGSNIPVNVNHQFRIASVSKPITSTMIMRLVEEGRISLDDTVFGTDGILADSYVASDPNVRAITIRHLLEHTAGEEWSNERDDPMFANPLMTHHELIQWVLDNRRLVLPPGSTYHYSNFGYSVLGRVIERVTGEAYDDYFRTMTAPLGLSAFAIASDFEAGGILEVQYYAQENTSPYAFPIARMDSHGGWKTTPEDMAKFLLVVDGFSEPADILQPQTIIEMTTPGLQNGNYAKGWAVNSSNNWWHLGSLPGTASVAVRTSSNMAWAVFVNTRSPDSGFDGALDNLMWQVVQGVHQ